MEKSLKSKNIKLVKYQNLNLFKSKILNNIRTMEKLDFLILYLN